MSRDRPTTSPPVLLSLSCRATIWHEELAAYGLAVGDFRRDDHLPANDLVLLLLLENDIEWAHLLLSGASSLALLLDKQRLLLLNDGGRRRLP